MISRIRIIIIGYFSRRARARVCVCVCVRACVRARARAHVCVCREEEGEILPARTSDFPMTISSIRRETCLNEYTAIKSDYDNAR